MKPKFWKRMLSYFYDVPIERTGSDNNPVLDVFLVKGRYQLCTDKAIYSFADKYDNFRDTFEQIILPDDGAVALLLGLGLGSIPFMLENTFKKKYSYTGIELDDEIIYLASKYVLDDLKSDIEIHTADAMVFMEINDQKYDMICMDIFDSDVIPAQFETKHYLEKLKSALSPDGLLIYNRLYQTKSDQVNTSKFYEAFVTVFPDARKLPIAGNMMILSK